jgi:uncharacterized membrane protein
MTFIEEYFINPILINGFFNPVNTLIYSVILILTAILVYLKILKPMKIEINRNFTFALLPFIFFASTTRVLRDFAYLLAQNQAISSNTFELFRDDIFYQIGLIQSEGFSYLSTKLSLAGFNGFYSWVIALFPTPGSYIITFLFALISLLISLIIQKYTKKPYWKIMVLIGFPACILNLYLLPPLNFTPFSIVMGVTILFAVVFFLMIRFSSFIKYGAVKEIFTRENSSLLSVHMLDASATWAALSFYGYAEQHPLPRLVTGLFTPAGMFFLKLVMMIPVLYIIGRYAERGDFKNFLLILILILGLAPGLRDMIRLMAGV